jgi:hypothetical protein
MKNSENLMLQNIFETYEILQMYEKSKIKKYRNEIFKK